MAAASALFSALDFPDEQRLLVVLGMIQILPEAFDERTAAQWIKEMK